MNIGQFVPVEVVPRLKPSTLSARPRFCSHIHRYSRKFRQASRRLILVVSCLVFIVTLSVQCLQMCHDMISEGIVIENCKIRINRTSFWRINKVNCTLFVHNFFSLLTSSRKTFRMLSIVLYALCRFLRSLMAVSKMFCCILWQASIKKVLLQLINTVHMTFIDSLLHNSQYLVIQ